MDKKRSIAIFLGLLLLYAAVAAASVFLPQGAAVEALGPARMPAPLPVMALAAAAVILSAYGILGFAGFFLARTLGFPELWDAHVNNWQRFLIPGLVGAALGVMIILVDLIFSPINGIGRLPHPPFPTSLVAALSAGIGEEMLFRLFFTCLWTWLVSKIILRGRFQTPVYWAISVLAAAAFAMSHLPSIMILQGWTSFSRVPTGLLVEILLLNGLISLAAAYLFKKFGFLAPVGVHFWADVVWHVVWGMF